jgi:hypothetical protein
MEFPRACCTDLRSCFKLGEFILPGDEQNLINAKGDFIGPGRPDGEIDLVSSCV